MQSDDKDLVTDTVYKETEFIAYALSPMFQA
jgi:hypothetical protein